MTTAASTAAVNTKPAGKNKAGAPSLRLRFFLALAGDKMTWAQMTKALKLKPGHGSVGAVKRGEVAAGRWAERLDVDGSGREVTVYSLTALGRRHLEAGRVDSYARERRLDAVGRGYIDYQG